ncbi:MAG: peptidoglycan-associated lipoprotein [candidate division Zixibacteria bacterium 4484_93]|nr:MAG: peptidoglycan-associated lipoprotein [candidate division Zixibacteria bacterium 4484_93]
MKTLYFLLIITLLFVACTPRKACYRGVCEQAAPPETAALPSGPVEIETEETEAQPVEKIKLETVFFEFNSFSLTPEARRTVEANTEILLASPDMCVTLEGYCDERGTEQYNLALGQKRAETVRGFLVKNGVEPDRIKLVSYGEDNPLDTGHTEEAWAKNRRVEFTVRERR